MLADDLRDCRGLAQKAMFGGMAWLLEGKLLCAASSRGLLVRLGKGNDDWALRTAGITSMTMRGRSMSGWVQLAPETCADHRLRQSLLQGAIRFVQSLPRKDRLP